MCPIVLATETKRSLRCEVRDLHLCWKCPPPNLIFHTFPVDPTSQEAEFRSRDSRLLDSISTEAGISVGTERL